MTEREREHVDAAAGLIIEFYGMPRQRAGRVELTVPAGPLPQLLAAIREGCPGLADLVDQDGRLAKHYLLSVDGQSFVDDPEQRFEPGTRLLLLSADAGG